MVKGGRMWTRDELPADAVVLDGPREVTATSGMDAARFFELFYAYLERAEPPARGARFQVASFSAGMIAMLVIIKCASRASKRRQAPKACE